MKQPARQRGMQAHCEILPKKARHAQFQMKLRYGFGRGYQASSVLLAKNILGLEALVGLLELVLWQNMLKKGARAGEIDSSSHLSWLLELALGQRRRERE